MKKIPIVLLFFCIIFAIQLSVISYQLSAQDSSISSPQPPTPGPQQLPIKKFFDGEVIIKFRETATDSVKKSIVDKHMLRTIQTIKRFRLQHMKLPPGINVEAFVQKLKKERHIEYAEPNYKRKPLVVTPDDPSWPQQWGMAKISIPDAWGINKGSKNVIVAVIDTGVDYTHPDLAENIWTNTTEIAGNGADDDGNTRIDDISGWNFYCPENTDYSSCEGDNNPMDTHGHGTHVAGIIGAMGNNNTGVTGVNWNVSVMPLRFMDNSGGVAAEVKAIDYAITMGAKVINASYGDSSFSRAEYDAIKHAADHGILVVAAAGNSTKDNDGISKNYPASYSIENKVGKTVYPPLPNIISVAATKQNDSLASYSNYGATSVHLGAPGGDRLPDLPIYSTAINGGYQSMSGTSMATPFVAGTAALLWAQRPDATYIQIKEAILQSVDAVPALSGKVVSGGRLNAFKALQKINELIVEIPLRAGWNFISTPIGPIDPSMNTVLKDISPNVRIIWGYDNASKAWLKYRGQGSGVRGQDTLASIEAGKGYWIYMDNPATITISGQPTALSPQSVSLYNGWNLVGFSGADNAGVDNELAKLGNDWVIVWAWTGGEWYAKQSPSLNYSAIQPLNSLSQGKAYWIKMNSGTRKIEWVQ